MALNERLPVKEAFALIDSVVGVVAHTELELLDEKVTRRFGRSATWSGMCIPCPGGDHLVVYNGSHSPTRTRATLMEEFFHLWLDHPPSKLKLFPAQPSRSFSAQVESEAYGSGAAALVPYQPLRSMVKAGQDASQIAQHFEVSEQLVQFRMKVSRIRAPRAAAA